jgi:heme-degrading monooxygenase HmoA
MTTPGYTFVSVSTAKPHKLDQLVELARRPNEAMDEHVPGLIARQVSVDRDRNAVVVWATFESKNDLYDWLSTDAGREEHGDEEAMTETIDTFQMYDLEPISVRL